MILSILATLSILMLNPLAQIQKGQDAQRMHDLKQLATGLDSYFNDKNFYPQDITALVSEKNIPAIPNDPTAASGVNYGYIYDGQDSGVLNKPQWNVLFAKLAAPASSQASFSCPLTKMTDSNGRTCLPNRYSTLGYNYCVISGSINCDQVTGITVIPLPISTSPATTPTPTSEPFYCSCSGAGFYKDPNITDPNHQCQIYDSNQGVRPNSELRCDKDCINSCTP